MAGLTVREILQLPLLKQASPVVLAGASALDATVGWVHASELVDIAPLLREGDLVLSTGIALPGTSPGLREFAHSLAEAGAAGLVLELGRRWTTVPATLVEACEAESLPLVALTHEVKFAAITQAVGERLVGSQLTDLREAERIHELLTELSMVAAGPREILAAVQRLSGSAVVLESDQHRVLDYLSGPVSIADFLDDWQTRSRRVDLTGRTRWDEANGWLLSRLGTPERGLGRLILASPQKPTRRHIALVEGAAAALTPHRLHHRDRDTLVRGTARELLHALEHEPASPDLLRRCELAGLPISHRQFVGMVIRPTRTAWSSSGQSRSPTQEALAATVRACREQAVPALVAQVDDDTHLLLSIGTRAAAESLAERLASQISRHQSLVVGAGPTAGSPDAIGRTLGEARQVVDAVSGDSGLDPARSLCRLPDVHLRGLLGLWGDDDRLQLFVSRELDALKTYDREHESNLIATLRALVVHESKSDAAAELHLSRAAFYSRLTRIERHLGVRLDDAETRTSLHVALIADDLAEQRRRHRFGGPSENGTG